MGIFQEFVKVFNRAPLAVSVTFDGQQQTIPPGHHSLPKICLLHAKNQNPIMGTQDPYNPHVSGGVYLIVEEGEVGYGKPLTQAEWTEHLSSPCRVNERVAFADKYGSDPKARMVILGKGRPTTANSRYEAGGTPAGISSFEGER